MKYSAKNYHSTKKNHKKKKNKGSKLLKFLLITAFIVPLYAITYATTLQPLNEIHDNNSTINQAELSPKSVVYSSSNQYSDPLADLSKEYKNINTILENIEDYPDELLDLILKNHETIDFVMDYPNCYPLSETEADIDISSVYVEGEIPLFLQWDKRWGYYDYGEDMIAINGCGPTALSMVIVGLTGDTKQNPKVIADYSRENGYYDETYGTSWSLMSEGSAAFGLVSRELPLNENLIRAVLKRGEPIIASMRKGEFTTTGHYIVLTGINKEGKVLVNDSNSIERSNRVWDMDVFMKQTKNLWSFSNGE